MKFRGNRDGQLSIKVNESGIPCILGILRIYQRNTITKLSTVAHIVNAYIAFRFFHRVIAIGD